MGDAPMVELVGEAMEAQGLGAGRGCGRMSGRKEEQDRGQGMSVGRWRCKNEPTFCCLSAGRVQRGTCLI